MLLSCNCRTPVFAHNIARVSCKLRFLLIYINFILVFFETEVKIISRLNLKLTEMSPLYNVQSLKKLTFFHNTDKINLTPYEICFKGGRSWENENTLFIIILLENYSS